MRLSVEHTHTILYQPSAHCYMQVRCMLWLGYMLHSINNMCVSSTCQHVCHISQALQNTSTQVCGEDTSSMQYFRLPYTTCDTLVKTYPPALVKVDVPLRGVSRVSTINHDQISDEGAQPWDHSIDRCLWTMVTRSEHSNTHHNTNCAHMNMFNWCTIKIGH